MVGTVEPIVPILPGSGEQNETDTANNNDGGEVSETGGSTGGQSANPTPVSGEANGVSDNRAEDTEPVPSGTSEPGDPVLRDEHFRLQAERVRDSYVTSQLIAQPPKSIVLDNLLTLGSNAAPGDSAPSASMDQVLAAYNAVNNTTT